MSQKSIYSVTRGNRNLLRMKVGNAVTADSEQHRAFTTESITAKAKYWRTNFSFTGTYIHPHSRIKNNFRKNNEHVRQH